MTKRTSPSYRFGVQWIADNDDVSEMDIEVVKSQISVLLLADLFGREPERVARDVIDKRNREIATGN